MSSFSGFAPFGLLDFSGAATPAEEAYAAAKSSLGGAALNLGQDGANYEESRLYALAIQAGVARATIERAYNQSIPTRAVDLLPSLEIDWGVIPGATDSLQARQAAVAGQELLMSGSRQEAIETALAALLGAEFYDLRVTQPSEVVVTPANPLTRGTFQNTSTAPKFLRLTDVALPGLPVPCEILGSSEPPIVGDVFSVEPNIDAVSERVTLSAVSNLVGSTCRVTANFAHTHGEGAYAMTCAPLWLSNQREVRVIVSARAAYGAETRRKIHTIMARHEKTVTRWRIMAAASPTTVGPWIVGVARVGATALGDIAFTF